MPPTNGFSLGIRGRILVLFGLCTAVLLAAAAYGFWQYAASVQLFERDVKASHANAVDVLTIETSFKKQVQEWKDVLLRGKKVEALDKHWNAFQQREGDVSRLAERMRASVTDTEASQLIGQFGAAHKQMGEAYRRGLETFKERGFDSAADFIKHYRRLSAIVIRQREKNVLWLNPIARHKLPPEIMNVIQRL